MVGTILYFIAVGLLAGYAARFVVRLTVRGRNGLGLVQTLLLGLAGSVVGGFVGYLLFNADRADGAFQTSGVLGSIVGAILALLVFRVLTERKVKLRRHHFLRHKLKSL
jgi:uncharacterized membrane protein YeaQ/YmgE (transglycosylase-associated protein family)